MNAPRPLETGRPTIAGVSQAGGAQFVPADDPVVVEATAVVQRGDLAQLETLLADHPWLATARFGDADCHRTLLHAATDWPGHYPNCPAVVARVVRAGADVNAHSRFDHHTETPLHWAASSGDVATLMPCWTQAPTSKRPVPCSAAGPRSPTPAASGTSSRRAGWSSAVHRRG